MAALNASTPEGEVHAQVHIHLLLMCGMYEQLHANKTSFRLPSTLVNSLHIYFSPPSHSDTR